ncbi:RNA polymerase sigma factor [Caulobacter mirabilis]|uniref:RNA polymerase subunit sigma-24 n=1 Tax=Caulobacter mirabilis TaxID=69666 RepID=A0A2D2AZC8_9CAUL|nr:sigma-70 family RNA polymerase sigma factor [Caulobacter mirabilis]ATQ43368.1 RNA polymerase subunit sigma-24 [Caulobacter mirabilis]
MGRELCLSAPDREEARRAEEISTRCGEALRGFFARRLSIRADVEDLTQEACARVLRRGRVGEIENLDGYLFQVAANLLRERNRQRRRRHADAHVEFEEADVGLWDELSPERVLLGREAYGAAMAALMELPERARRIFMLNRFEEVPGAEIASRLGVSVSTVEKDMMRVVAHLRGRLQ